MAQQNCVVTPAEYLIYIYIYLSIFILCIWMVKLLCFASFFLCKLSKYLFLCLQDLGMEEQLRRHGLLEVCFTTTPSRHLIDRYIRYMISHIPMIWYPMTLEYPPETLVGTDHWSIHHPQIAWQVLGPISYGWSCHPAAVGVSCAPSKACQRPNLISSKWYHVQCPWHPEVIDTFDPKNKQEAGDLE